MPDLDFQMEGAEVDRYSATPRLIFKLRVTNAVAGESIQNVGLQCQIQIETARRCYQPEEQERLLELFGEPERWGQTLRPLLWTHTSVAIPPFEGSCLVDLPVPCTYDFNVAAVKYFYGLEQGEAPLVLLFSGSVFYQQGSGGLRVSQISWSKEARFSLPVQMWKEMMEHYYPNNAWLCLRKDVFDRLYDYKMRGGIPTWEQALEGLLDSIEEEIS